MALSSVPERIASLEASLLTPLNKSKKKRIYFQLAKLRKALMDPSLLVDTSDKQEKQDFDKKRRVDKKLQKKKENQQVLAAQNASSGVQCLACRELGHYAQDCPTTQEMKGNNMQVRICYNCGKNDHTAKECRKKKKGNSGTQTRFFNCQPLPPASSAAPRATLSGSVQKMKRDCTLKGVAATSADPCVTPNGSALTCPKTKSRTNSRSWPKRTRTSLLKRNPNFEIFKFSIYKFFETYISNLI